MAFALVRRSPGLAGLLAAQTISPLGDAKSPWFTGHSRGVAALARAAAGLASPADATAAYRAGLLHDLGRVAVPAGAWERPGPLRAQEWEQVRLHPYHTGRILARSAVLAPLGLIAGRHHERVNGSGYPAGIGGAEMDMAACLLAAGRTKPQIATDLVISPSTVHTHTVHIYAKCGVSTRAGLAMFAMRHGLAARIGPAAVAKID